MVFVVGDNQLALRYMTSSVIQIKLIHESRNLKNPVKIKLTKNNKHAIQVS